MNLILLFILQIILIIILATFLYVLFTESRVLNLEQRLSNYSISSVDEQSIPLFEKLLDKIWEKSDILRKYSKRFDKYINYKELEYKSGFDYLSVKFLISLLFGIIYIISSLIQSNFNPFLLLSVMMISYFIIDIYLI